MKKYFILFLIFILLLLIFLTLKNKPNIKDDYMNNTLILTINNEKLLVKLAGNKASQEFYQRVKTNPLTINAKEYGGFEKVGNLGFNLPKEDVKLTTKARDIVLYNGNEISLFYNSNTWNYTKLGEIINITDTELKNLLPPGDVTLTFTLN